MRPAPELVEGLDGAPLAHPGLVVDVFRHWSWRQGLQVRAFLLQLFLHQAVAPVHYLLDEGGVLLEGAEITAAPQHQGLVDGVLEPVMGLLHDTVFVGLAGIDPGGLEPIVLQELGVAVVQDPSAAAPHLAGGGEVLSERITRGLPPSAQRAFCSPCFRARKVSPVATSA